MYKVYFIDVTFVKGLLVKEPNKNITKSPCSCGFFYLLINVKGKLFLHLKKKNEKVHLFPRRKGL